MDYYEFSAGKGNTHKGKKLKVCKYCKDKFFPEKGESDIFCSIRCENLWKNEKKLKDNKNERV